jgi:hypothetical protein
MEPNATRFPFPLPPRTIGEQKAKVNSFFRLSQLQLIIKKRFRLARRIGVLLAEVTRRTPPRS